MKQVTLFKFFALTATLLISIKFQAQPISAYPTYNGSPSGVFAPVIVPTGATTFANRKYPIDSLVTKVKLRADSIANAILLNGKQPTLTTGTGIAIVGNTISATGGGGGAAFPYIGVDNDTISYEPNILKFKNNQILFDTRKFIAGSYDKAAIQYGTLQRGYEERIYPTDDKLMQSKLWEVFPYQTGIDTGVHSWYSLIGSNKYDSTLPRDVVFTSWANGDQSNFNTPYIGQRIESSYYNEWEPHMLIVKPRNSTEEVRVCTYNINQNTGWGHKQERFRSWSIWNKEPGEIVNDAMNMGNGSFNLQMDNLNFKPKLNNPELCWLQVQMLDNAVQFRANNRGDGLFADRTHFLFDKAFRVRPSRFFYDEASLEVVNKNGNNRGLYVINESNLPVLATNGRQRVGIGASEYPSATLHVKKGTSDAALLSSVIIEDLPIYADDAAAGTAGLTTGMLYRINAGLYKILAIKD